MATTEKASASIENIGPEFKTVASKIKPKPAPGSDLSWVGMVEALAAIRNLVQIYIESDCKDEIVLNNIKDISAAAHAQVKAPKAYKDALEVHGYGDM